MPLDPINVQTMLHGTFLKSELAFLNEQGPFIAAVFRARTQKDFEELCKLSEELFGAHNHANPGGRQFRTSFDPSSRRAPDEL